MVVCLIISSVSKRKSTFDYSIENINGDVCVMVIFYHGFSNSTSEDSPVQLFFHTLYLSHLYEKLVQKCDTWQIRGTCASVPINVGLLTINVLLLIEFVPGRRVYVELGLICHASVNNFVHVTNLCSVGICK